MAEDYTYTVNDQRVECPYCGELNDMHESVCERGESLDSWTCKECEKEFIVRLYFGVSVTATRKP
jgi:transposase-like protein